MSSGEDVLVLIGRLPLMLPLFAMVLLRISGLMITAPIYGSQVIPIRVRAMFAVGISLAVFPVVSMRVPADVTLAGVIGGAFGELLIGLIMGLGLSLVFMGAELAGMVIGQQAGLSLGQVFDPVTGTEVTTLGQVFFVVAMLIFLIVGGHRELMRALLDTYEVIPPLSYRFSDSMLDMTVDLMRGSFILAMRLAGPALISLLIASLVMGFLSRTMPQLNILSVGFVLRALVALGAAALALAASQAVMVGAIEDSIERIREAFGL